MLYLYKNNRLKPLKTSYDKAITIARNENVMLVSNSIDEMIHIASYELSAFLVHKKNSESIFKYWYLQIKNFTIKEFNIILFATKHDAFYSLLKLAASASMGKYKLIDFKGVVR